MWQVESRSNSDLSSSRFAGLLCEAERATSKSSAFLNHPQGEFVGMNWHVWIRNTYCGTVTGATHQEAVRAAEKKGGPQVFASTKPSTCARIHLTLLRSGDPHRHAGRRIGDRAVLARASRPLPTRPASELASCRTGQCTLGMRMRPIRREQPDRT
jgi:hypothetical protein